jgi:hypothetical protein
VVTQLSQTTTQGSVGLCLDEGPYERASETKKR